MAEWCAVNAEDCGRVSAAVTAPAGCAPSMSSPCSEQMTCGSASKWIPRARSPKPRATTQRAASTARAARYRLFSIRAFFVAPSLHLVNTNVVRWGFTNGLRAHGLLRRNAMTDRHSPMSKDPNEFRRPVLCLDATAQPLLVKLHSVEKP